MARYRLSVLMPAVALLAAAALPLSAQSVTRSAVQASATLSPASLVVAQGAADTSDTPSLETVLSRFDEVQQSIRTLRAELKMTTINRLLQDPMVYEGTFFMTKPDAIRWEFETPEPMRFVIANDLYVGYYPEQNRAERQNVRRRSERLFRYFGLGQGSAELTQTYNLELLPADPEVPDTYLLSMSPKKRRVRKRIEDVRFWVHKDTMLPVRVEYHSADGNVRVVEFNDMKTNVEIEPGVYIVELPDDVKVQRSFSPFGGS